MFAAHAVRQKCRPKHQVLILKCYPAFQKNVLDMKPNSSELSYMLYYASTRRSKLQKVGVFLEKKATSDVSKGKIGYAGSENLSTPDKGKMRLTEMRAAMYRSHSRYFRRL